MKKITLSLLLLGLTACQQSGSVSDNTPAASTKAATAITNIAGIKFIEQVSAKGDETVIPYQKYELANGLTVLLHQDHSGRSRSRRCA